MTLVSVMVILMNATKKLVVLVLINVLLVLQLPNLVSLVPKTPTELLQPLVIVVTVIMKLPPVLPFVDNVQMIAPPVSLKTDLPLQSVQLVPVT
jgi:hypothetical protein